MHSAHVLLLALLSLPVMAADGIAERRLGMSYFEGDGVKQDVRKAVQHLARAVELGDAESAIRLGKMYEFGMSVAADETQAALWYMRGAELGSAEAQFEASVMLYKGRGVARDPVEAVKWWTLAARDPRRAQIIRASVESAEAKLTPDEISRGRSLAQAWLSHRTPSKARTGS